MAVDLLLHGLNGGGWCVCTRIAAQAEREADRRSIHEEGKRDPVIDFCGTGCLVFQ